MRRGSRYESELAATRLANGKVRAGEQSAKQNLFFRQRPQTHRRPGDKGGGGCFAKGNGLREVRKYFFLIKWRRGKGIIIQRIVQQAPRAPQSVPDPLFFCSASWYMYVQFTVRSFPLSLLSPAETPPFHEDRSGTTISRTPPPLLPRSLSRPWKAYLVALLHCATANWNTSRQNGQEEG